jgi:hypothetical protein
MGFCFDKNCKGSIISFWESWIWRSQFKELDRLFSLIINFYEIIAIKSTIFDQFYVF